MMKMKKLPIILFVIGIYLTYIAAGNINADSMKQENYILNNNILVYVMIGNIIMYVISLIFSIFIAKDKKYGEDLLRTCMILKIALIPYYIVIFLVGLFGIIAIVTPIGIGMIMMSCFMSGAVFLLMEIYSTIAVVKVCRKYQIRGMVLFIISQWIYVIDVVGITVFLFKVKKYKKNKNQIIEGTIIES